jgi:BirA family transcriptional regulator, biotin operon repressor / biotin---[acetyl-CoA-carboxylase] ligase
MLRNWHVHYFQEVPSTMDVAHDLILTKSLSLKDGMAVLAAAQTAGRGRHQRHWHSPEGNFYGSFTFLPYLPEPDYPLYTFAVSIALYDAINQLIRKGDFLKMKWPNDLLFKGKKIAGILLELSNTQPKHLIVGIGINLKSAPTPISYPATDLSSENQANILAQDFMPHFISHLTTILDLIETQGFSPIRQAWLAARYPQDTLGIKTHQNGIVVEQNGIFLDLDMQGRLILQEAHTNKPIAITAGDLFLSSRT